MKRILAMMLVLAMSCGLYGCGSQPAAEAPAESAPTSEAVAEAPAEASEAAPEESAADSDRKMVVGMSCINLSDAGLIQIKNGADLAAEDYNLELIWKACEGNLDTQIDQIRGFIQQGVDAVWIDSIDVAGIVGVVNEAVDAGIIVLTAGSKVEAEGNYNLIYPDYDDSFFAGAAIGEYYKEKAGTIGLIVASAGSMISEKRQEGFTDGLKSTNPDMNLAVGMGMWDANTSMTVAEDICRSNTDIIHMHVIADGMSYGAYRGVQNVGAKVTMSSNDAEPDALNYLESGEYILDNVVGNARLGYWGVAIARRLIDGVEMATDQFLPTYKVMGDEMRKIVEDAGLGELNGVKYDFVTIDEAREIVSSEYFQKEFDESFVPTK